MRLTKDEMTILSAAISAYKYELNDERNDKKLFIKLKLLEEKLAENGKDQRRIGRTSQNDWTDILKRFANTK